MLSAFQEPDGNLLAIYSGHWRKDMSSLPGGRTRSTRRKAGGSNPDPREVEEYDGPGCALMAHGRRESLGPVVSRHALLKCAFLCLSLDAELQLAFSPSQEPLQYADMSLHVPS